MECLGLGYDNQMIEHYTDQKPGASQELCHDHLGQSDASAGHWTPYLILPLSGILSQVMNRNFPSCFHEPERFVCRGLAQTSEDVFDTDHPVNSSELSAIYFLQWRRVQSH